MATEERLGFLGFGNMAYAIAKGLIDTGTFNPDQLRAYDVDEAKRDKAHELGMKFSKSSTSLVERCGTVVLAVKPQSMASALEHLETEHITDRLFISVAAGVTISYLESKLSPDAQIARVMPNTPALVGAGAAGIAMGRNCTKEQEAVAKRIFSAVGLAVVVKENQIDTVTALSGSGPAYFFYVAECLTRSAMKRGLSADVAAQLAEQTLYGAGKLMAESDESAAELRERVTSKGGTTEAALQVFEDESLSDIIGMAMDAAMGRADQLSQ